jgi:hypothetical protein
MVWLKVESTAYLQPSFLSDVNLVLDLSWTFTLLLGNKLWI